jgi:hypothetical protein
MIVSPARATYRYSYVIQVAALMPGILLALFGTLMAQASQRREDDYGVLGVLVGVTVVGIILFLYLHKQSVSIHDEGIVERRLFFGEKQIEWKDIKETRYRQTALSQDLLLHFGLLGALFTPFVGKGASSKKGTQELKVISRQNTKITLSNYFKNVREAIRTVLDRVNPVFLDSARTELRQGKEVSFGDVVLTSFGIKFKKKQIAYADIEYAKITGREFRVKQSGKWLDAIVVPSQKIPNVFIALDLIQESRTGGAVVDKSQNSIAATV